MAKSSKTSSAEKRVKVKDLPKAKRKLTAKNMKDVRGGAVNAYLVFQDSAAPSKPK